MSSKLKLFSFSGVIHPPENKHMTENKKIETCKSPDIVTIPLLQHTGAPCEPLVAKEMRLSLARKLGTKGI